MKVQFGLSYTVDYIPVDGERYVIMGRDVPMLLSGLGDPVEATKAAAGILIDYLSKETGLDHTTGYLTRKGAVVTVLNGKEPLGESRRLMISSARELALA